MRIERRHDSMDRSYRTFLSRRLSAAYLRVPSHVLDPKCGLPKGRTEVLIPRRGLILPEFITFLERFKAVTPDLAASLLREFPYIRGDTPVEPTLLPEMVPPSVPPPPTPAELARIAAETAAGQPTWDSRSAADALWSAAVTILAKTPAAPARSSDHKPFMLEAELLQRVTQLSVENEKLALRVSTLEAELSGLRGQSVKSSLALHQLMDAGHVPFELAAMHEGKVWNSADLRKMGWYTIQDLYRQYRMRVPVVESTQPGITASQMNSVEFGALVYWVFFQKLRDASGVAVPRTSALTDKHVTMLRVRIPALNAHAREQKAIKRAVELKIPVAPAANWVWQPWYSEIGVQYLFAKFDELLHQWNAAGNPKHAVTRGTRTIPVDELPTEA